MTAIYPNQPMPTGGVMIIHTQPTAVKVAREKSMKFEGKQNWMAGSCGGCPSCLYGYFCPCCLACDVAYSAEECSWLPCICPGFSMVSIRTKMRMRLKIKGSSLGDACCVGCCVLCANCQMYEELKQQNQLKPGCGFCHC